MTPPVENSSLVHLTDAAIEVPQAPLQTTDRSAIRGFLIDYWESKSDDSMAHSMIFAPSDFEAVRRCVESFALQEDWLQQQCNERADLKERLRLSESATASAKQPLHKEMAALNVLVTKQNATIELLRSCLRRAGIPEPKSEPEPVAEALNPNDQNRNLE